jgi:hypothetical protein
MESGHICFLDYDERPKVWHTRVLLSPTTADNWMVLTPDHDIYEEQMSLRNPDIIDFLYGGAGGSLAPHIDPYRVYAFQPMTPAALANFKLQGRVQGDAIRALAGLPPANAGPAAVPPAQAMPAAPAPAPDGGAVADTWIAMEDVGQYKRGDIVI